MGGLEARLAKLETALGAWFGRADEAHVAAAGSLASLHDGIWKGFDEAATHRRELAVAAKGDLKALHADVSGATAAAASSARAAEVAVLDALSVADAPLRRAAEVTLTLLPGVADCETRIAASVGDLRSAVATTEALARSASDAAASTGSGVKELIAAHSETAATVRDLAARRACVSSNEVDAVVRAVHADLQSTLSAAHAAASAAIERVDVSVRAIETAHSAGVGDSAGVAQTITGLRQDMWKGFDDAATHRRELAGAAKGDLAALQSDVSSAAVTAAGSARAAEAAIVAALSAADAPLRRAAEVTLALLPGTAETVTLIASTTSELRGSVEAARSGAASAAAAAEAGSVRAVSSQAEIVAAVKTEADRTTGAILAAIGSASAETRGAVQGSVGAAQAALKEAIDGVQVCLPEKQEARCCPWGVCSLCRAFRPVFRPPPCSRVRPPSRGSAARLRRLKMCSRASRPSQAFTTGSGRDSTRRRHSAANSQPPQRATSLRARQTRPPLRALPLSSHSSCSHIRVSSKRRWRRCRCVLRRGIRVPPLAYVLPFLHTRAYTSSPTQAALRDAHIHALRHADTTTDLAATVRDGFGVAARAEALERSAGERAAEHQTLVVALAAVSEALAEKTAASATSDATTRAELERLGAGLQELAYRVDALAQVRDALPGSPRRSSSTRVPPPPPCRPTTAQTTPSSAA